MNSEQGASRLLDGLSESINIDPDRLARVAGQFITPDGAQVYPAQINGRTVYVTVPEDYNSSQKCPAGAVAGVRVISSAVYRVDAICFNRSPGCRDLFGNGCNLKNF